MKKILLSTVATGALLFATSVNAADMPVKAARAAPAVLPAFSWTGCYAGVQAGYGWGKNDFTHAQTITRTFAPSSGFVGAAGIDTSGAVFGGQIGCDWQVSPNFVLGVQGMFSGTDLDGHTDTILGGSTSTFDVRTKWLGSVTGSLGFTNFAGPDKMVYVKGGGAWARQQFDRALGPSTIGVPTSFAYDISGWTVGGGIKWRIMPNWTAFAEYNHYDFGTKTLYANSVTQTGPLGLIETDTLTMKSKIETVTVGINYQFSTR